MSLFSRLGEFLYKVLFGTVGLILFTAATYGLVSLFGYSASRLAVLIETGLVVTLGISVLLVVELVSSLYVRNHKVSKFDGYYSISKVFMGLSILFTILIFLTDIPLNIKLLSMNTIFLAWGCLVYFKHLLNDYNAKYAHYEHVYHQMFTKIDYLAIKQPKLVIVRFHSPIKDEEIVAVFEKYRTEFENLDVEFVVESNRFYNHFNQRQTDLAFNTLMKGK